MADPFWRRLTAGWHIECSAMAMAYLGETLDIHAGGVDLVFPHHENEISQSEGITGKPFARFWLHSEHLHIESQKMSKSLGNFYTLRDLLDMGNQPEIIRYLLASVPYRKKLNFTFDGLKAAAKSIERLRDFEARVTSAKLAGGRNQSIAERSAAAVRQFEEALDEDLNTAEALAAIFEYVRAMNTALDENQFQEDNRWDAARVLEIFDSIFDVLKPSAGGVAKEDRTGLMPRSKCSLPSAMTRRRRKASSARMKFATCF